MSTTTSKPPNASSITDADPGVVAPMANRNPAMARKADRPEGRPDMARLLEDLNAVRRTGIAVNLERSERGVAAVGVPVRDSGGETVAAVSLSMPTVRYEPERVGSIVTALRATSKAISREL